MSIVKLVIKLRNMPIETITHPSLKFGIIALLLPTTIPYAHRKINVFSVFQPKMCTNWGDYVIK